MLDFSVLKRTRTGLVKAIGASDVSYLTKALAKEFINLNFIGDDGNTPLHLTAISGNVEVAKILVQHGASQHIKNKNGWFPIHLASYYGHMEMMMFLLNSKNFEHQPTILVNKENVNNNSNRKSNPVKKSKISKREDECLLLESMSDDESDYSQMSGVFEMSHSEE